MEKRIYMKPLLKSFLIEPMDILAASPSESSKLTKSSIILDDDVTSGDNDDTDPWGGDVNYIR